MPSDTLTRASNSITFFIIINAYYQNDSAKIRKKNQTTKYFYGYFVFHVKKIVITHYQLGFKV